MASAEYSISIKKPVHEIFDFIRNGDNNKLWRPSVIKVNKETKGEIGVGTKYSQTMKGPFGKNISGDYEITHYDLDRKLSFKVISGPARPIGDYVFEDKGGETKVTFSLSYTPHGLGKIMEPMINKQMQKETALLLNIKKYLER
ncbi:SRPBCC family protein [Sporolactobacillus kofuensis]|uniref:SRPBCC family protein n=1 Tax=Sporolactobacillus kofuensis TaxID=269672 RepID=A0ABW1WH23_9BACL|nr:SRPBCC family protein [Sporolactobacillus kofuensis]MCO7176194.1 SRPBCC family protein [Sporolactobacillus kofuensis]